MLKMEKELNQNGEREKWCYLTQIFITTILSLIIFFQHRQDEERISELEDEDSQSQDETNPASVEEDRSHSSCQPHSPPHNNVHVGRAHIVLPSALR